MMDVGVSLRAQTQLALDGNLWAFAVEVGTFVVKGRALVVIGARTVWTSIAVKS